MSSAEAQVSHGELHPTEEVSNVSDIWYRGHVCGMRFFSYFRDGVV